MTPFLFPPGFQNILSDQTFLTELKLKRISMINKIYRLTALMACSLVVLFFTPFHSQASVGDTFTKDQLKYTVLFEDNTAQTGTVSVESKSKNISGIITIPETIERDGYTYSVMMIPDFAFKECKELTGITISKSITSIGEWAFYRCLHLKNVNIPNKITTIKCAVFCCCWDLEEITIPNNVTEIDFAAFAFCCNLKEVEIPESMTRLGDAAFADCRSLTFVHFKGSKPEMGQGVFADCDLLNKDFLDSYE